MTAWGADIEKGKNVPGVSQLLADARVFEEKDDEFSKQQKKLEEEYEREADDEKRDRIMDELTDLKNAEVANYEKLLEIYDLSDAVFKEHEGVWGDAAGTEALVMDKLKQIKRLRKEISDL
jgi:hypothetical protein